MLGLLAQTISNCANRIPEDARMPDVGSAWKCVMTLDEQRKLLAGDPSELRAAVARGADLRIYSEFVHNEHIDPQSDWADPIQESMDMRCTYLVDRRWVASMLTLRQPVELPHGFGRDYGIADARRP